MHTETVWSIAMTHSTAGDIIRSRLRRRSEGCFDWTTYLDVLIQLCYPLVGDLVIYNEIGGQQGLLFANPTHFFSVLDHHLPSSGGIGIRDVQDIHQVLSFFLDELLDGWQQQCTEQIFLVQSTIHLVHLIHLDAIRFLSIASPQKRTPHHP